MTTDDRPSIAELQRIEREIGTADWTGKDPYGAAAFRNAAPVLLEIAAATKALQSEGWDFRSATMDMLLAALAKVRP